MNDANAFTKMIPGFDFLQGLMKNAAGGTMPTMGQWIAPTLNPEELDKRVNELKAVKFWLEQNSRMLDATIQALEVQRMTLSTLKTMNLQVADLQQAMTLKVPDLPTPAPVAAPVAAPEPAPAPAPRKPRKPAPKATSTPEPSPAPGAVDPMQWWSALTQQFGELASNAMKDGGAGVARNIGAMMATPPAAKSAPASTPAPAGKAVRPRKR